MDVNILIINKIKMNQNDMRRVQQKNVLVQGNIHEDGQFPSSRNNDQTNMTSALKNSSHYINHNIK